MLSPTSSSAQPPAGSSKNSAGDGPLPAAGRELAATVRSVAASGGNGDLFRVQVEVNSRLLELTTRAPLTQGDRILLRRRDSGELQIRLPAPAAPTAQGGTPPAQAGMPLQLATPDSARLQQLLPLNVPRTAEVTGSEPVAARPAAGSTRPGADGPPAGTAARANAAAPQPAPAGARSEGSAPPAPPEGVTVPGGRTRPTQPQQPGSATPPSARAAPTTEPAPHPPARAGGSRGQAGAPEQPPATPPAPRPAPAGGGAEAGARAQVYPAQLQPAPPSGGGPGSATLPAQNQTPPPTQPAPQPSGQTQPPAQPTAQPPGQTQPPAQPPQQAPSSAAASAPAASNQPPAPAQPPAATGAAGAASTSAPTAQPLVANPAADPQPPAAPARSGAPPGTPSADPGAPAGRAGLSHTGQTLLQTLGPQTPAQAQRHLIQLTLNQQTLALISPKPLLTGQQVILTRVGEQQVNLQPLATPSTPAQEARAQQPMQQALRESLPRQIPFGDALNQLVQLSRSPAARGQGAIGQLVQSMLSLFSVSPGSSDAEQAIQRNLHQGGLLTESRLAQGGGSERGAPPDLKQQLGQLLKAAEQLPPDARQQMRRLVEGLQARTTTQQISSLQAWQEQPDGTQERVYRLDLPIRLADRYDNAELTITQQRRRGSRGETETLWGVALHFDLARYGSVDARLSLSEGWRLQVQLWAEQAATLRQIERRLDQFSAGLHQQGFLVETLQARQGRPSQPELTDLHRRLVDLHT